jgi:hypothetical protein
MYALEGGNRRKDGTWVPIWYYHCYGPAGNGVSACRNMMRMAELDGAVGLWINKLMGDYKVIAVMRVPGRGHEDEIALVEQDIKELDLDDPGFDHNLATLRSERARLQSLPAEPGRVIERDIGQTVADYWAGLDVQGRRTFLMAGDVRLEVSKGNYSLSCCATRELELAWTIPA